MTELKPGDVLIIRHPYFDNRHLVARVSHCARAMCDIEHFTHRGEWTAPVRRKLDGLVVRNFGPDVTDEQAALSGLVFVGIVATCPLFDND